MCKNNIYFEVKQRYYFEVKQRYYFEVKQRYYFKVKQRYYFEVKQRYYFVLPQVALHVHILLQLQKIFQQASLQLEQPPKHRINIWSNN